MPICPVLDGDVALFATEGGSTKIRNIRAHPRVALMFDDYVEDWRVLRGVMIRGEARVIDDGPGWERARDLLYEKYRQYEVEAPIEAGKTVIVEVTIESIAGSL